MIVPPTRCFASARLLCNAGQQGILGTDTTAMGRFVVRSDELRFRNNPPLVHRKRRDPTRPVYLIVGPSVNDSGAFGRGGLPPGHCHQSEVTAAHHMHGLARADDGHRG